MTKTGPLTYLISSTGTAEGRPRRVTQEFVENPLFPFAVFADQAIHFQGNGEVGSYTSNANGAPATQDAVSTGFIGTNGTIATNGGVTSGGVGLFNNEGGASCSGPVCSNTLPGFPKSAKFPIDSMDAIAASTIQNCKNLQGTLKPFVASKNGTAGFGTLQAGVNCFSSVDLDVPLTGFPGTAANPVKIYVDGGNIRISKNNIGLGAFGYAPAFQIYATQPTTQVMFDKDGVLVGALWAPRSDCTNNDPSFEGVNVYGAATCKTFGKNAGTGGNGNFKAMYDNSLSSIGSGVFTQGRFREE